MRILADVWGDSPKEAAEAMRELADRLERGETVARGGYHGRGYDCQGHPGVTPQSNIPEPHGWNCDSGGLWHFYPRRSRGIAHCGKMRTGGGYVPQREKSAKGNCPACLEIIQAREATHGPDWTA